ncbi:uncharacterized protein LOC106780598 [Vigna radiata var. radiata]|uniref:Uncharacterized protein LOC106780598 n=1 Tax=Vigna radiata var. radiata TaxID=3916 RepID=A0A1S3W1F9_VIGRR|nr:uncharacterized protein LOC106780598 [Vigna radiata var. radiata]
MINSFFVVCLVIIGVSIPVYGSQDTLKEDLELERQLELINKPPVKTIHTKNGDIVDCIDIYKQLAFDHPLLKNHKIQRKPSFQKSSTKNLADRSSFRLEKVQCPKGYIPVRRTIKEDLIREKQLLKSSIFVQDIPGVHLAELTVGTKYGPYYGANGRNSIYNPPVTNGQISLSHVWVQNGPINTNNKISLGWQVSPDLYGDNKTHLYASWTSDNFHRTGCYNIRCPGFVQINRQTYLGQVMTDISSYGGQTFDFFTYIYMDPKTKNWWLQIDGNDLGYYPAKLFSNMTSADKVGWGGRTLTPHGSTSPQMGSGHFPDRDLYHACYFRTITFENSSRVRFGPLNHQTEKYDDQPKCYGLTYYGDGYKDGGGHLLFMLKFGGPGGKCDDKLVHF